MRAISIKEPWASLILSGRKTIETRTWQTAQGDVLLCASKNPKSEISGKAFAVATIVSVQPMDEDHEEKACCEVYDGAYAWILADVRPIELFDVKGKLMFFQVPDELVKFK